jgi:hypothetical protein
MYVCTVAFLLSLLPFYCLLQSGRRSGVPVSFVYELPAFPVQSEDELLYAGTAVGRGAVAGGLCVAPEYEYVLDPCFNLVVAHALLQV